MPEEEDIEEQLFARMPRSADTKYMLELAKQHARVRKLLDQHRPRGVKLEHVQAVQEHLRRLSPGMMRHFDYRTLRGPQRDAFESLVSNASGEELKLLSKLLDLRTHLQEQIQNVKDARARRERLLKVVSGLQGEQRDVTSALFTLRGELEEQEDKIHALIDRVESQGLLKETSTMSVVSERERDILKKLELYRRHVERHRERHGESVHDFCDELLGEMEDKRKYYETRRRLIRLAHEVNEIRQQLRWRKR